jgi:acyl carrier protein
MSAADEMRQPPAPTEAAIIDRTRAWVRENFLYMRPDWPLGDDAPLLGSGVIDSIGVIELVEFLQSTFNVAIPESDITERNLGTLGAIGRYVYAKCRGEAGGGRWPLQVA